MRLLISLALTLTLLSGCDAPTATVAATAAAATPSAEAYATTAAEAHGFGSGNLVAAQTVYVFFDAQCPHCGVLWNAAKPLGAKVHFVWIPVGLLNPASTSQGAALLAATDPAAAMDAHEALMTQGSRGMTAPFPSEAQQALIQSNSKLLMKLGGQSIPYIVAKNPKTGAWIQQAGSVPEAQLRVLLGVEG